MSWKLMTFLEYLQIKLCLVAGGYFANWRFWRFLAVFLAIFFRGRDSPAKPNTNLECPSHWYFKMVCYLFAQFTELKQLARGTVIRTHEVIIHTKFQPPNVKTVGCYREQMRLPFGKYIVRLAENNSICYATFCFG